MAEQQNYIFVVRPAFFVFSAKNYCHSEIKTATLKDEETFI
jgi:hypothetical protein